jgi:two-component sensor histidine kinase
MPEFSFPRAPKANAAAGSRPSLARGPGRLDTFQGMPGRSVGSRALKVSAIVSTAFILLCAALFLALEGGRDSKAVDREVSRLVESQVPAIVEALWDYDDELLRALAEGLRMYPYINYVGIDAAGGGRTEAGARKPGSRASATPLRRRTRDGEFAELGAMIVEVDRGRIGDELLRTALPPMAILLASMTAMSLIQFFLFSRYTARHLKRIARYLESFDPKSWPEPLSLDKRRRGDELDLLADSFNSMGVNLRAAREAELAAMGCLVRSLREKEVLLQEIYHRTRNNMQLISAFLDMEAGPEPDPGTRTLVARTNGRIAAMALVHEKLCESEDLSRIDFGEYLADLAREIVRSSLARRPGIRIEVEAERGVVTLIDTAVPCALAVNELIANAIEHAFPEGRGGRIGIALARSGPGTLGLSVSDDGVGLPGSFDLRRDAKSGLRIAALLVESQLGGRIETVPGRGARFAIEIRDDIYEPRV